MTRIAKSFPYPKTVLCGTLFLGLLIGVHLLLPYAVNTENVRRMVIARASKAYNGEVEFAKFKPALLPWPHVRITRGRLSTDGRTTLQIHAASVYLKIWPLLTGKLRIDRIKLIAPSWRVDLGSLEASPSAENRPRPAVKFLAPFIGFLGNAKAKIVDGRLDLVRKDRIVATIAQINTRIISSEGHVHLEIGARPNFSGDLAITADLDLNSLNGRGRLSIKGFRSQDLPAIGILDPINNWLQTAVDLDADIQTVDMKRFQARFEARTPRLRVGRASQQVTMENVSIDGRADWAPGRVDVALSDLRSASPAMAWSGSLSWARQRSTAGAPIRISLKGADLEIAPIRDRLLRLFGGHPVVKRVLDIVRGGRVPHATLGVSASDWLELKKMKDLRVEADLTGGRIAVPHDLFDLEEVNGHVAIAEGRLTATGLSGRQGHTSASHGELTIGIYDGSRSLSLDALVDADAAELPGMVRKLVHNDAVRSQLDRLPAIAGRASGRLTVGDHWDRLSTKIAAKARIAAGDSALGLIGTFEDTPGLRPSAAFFVNGRMGSAVLDWVLGLGKVPPVLAPKAPLTVSGVDVALSPSGRIDLGGSCEWDDGTLVGGALTSAEDVFYLRQLHVRDAASDAWMTFRNHKADRSLDLGFSGHLEPATIGRFVDDRRLQAGAVQGELQVHVDREKPAASFLEGALSVRNLGYHLEKAGMIRIVAASVDGKGTRFEIPKAFLTWDESAISLVGDGRFTPEAIETRATLHADRFETRKATTILGSGPSASPQDGIRIPGLALPLIGTLKAKVDQLIYDRYRLSAVNATIEAKSRETLIDVAQADWCGIQMPGRIRVSDGLTHLAFTPHAQGSSLKAAGNCVLDSHDSEKLLGTLNLKGHFTTQGKNREALVANLKGAVDFTVEKGRITNVGSAGVFTNLLSYLSVNQYIQGNMSDLQTNDFVYNHIESRWTIEDGTLDIEEGVLKSNSVNLVAQGKYDLSSKDLDLVVLVSPLTTVDWIVEHIPVVGHILQGTLVAIPVRVKGPAADPTITPLSPKAIGARLSGILKRAFNAPVRIIEPLLKEGEKQEGPTNDGKGPGH